MLITNWLQNSWPWVSQKIDPQQMVIHSVINSRPIAIIDLDYLYISRSLQFLDHSFQFTCFMNSLIKWKEYTS